MVRFVFALRKSNMNKEQFDNEMNKTSMDFITALSQAVLKKGVEVGILFAAVGLLLFNRAAEQDRFDRQLSGLEEKLNRRIEMLSTDLERCDAAREAAIVQVERMMAKIESIERSHKK